MEHLLTQPAWVSDKIAEFTARGFDGWAVRAKRGGAVETRPAENLIVFPFEVVAVNHDWIGFTQGWKEGDTFTYREKKWDYRAWPTSVLDGLARGEQTTVTTDSYQMLLRPITNAGEGASTPLGVQLMQVQVVGLSPKGQVVVKDAVSHDWIPVSPDGPNTTFWVSVTLPQ